MMGRLAIVSSVGLACMALHADPIAGKPRLHGHGMQAGGLDAAISRIERSDVRRLRVERLANRKDVALACRLAHEFHSVAFAVDRPTAAGQGDLVTRASKFTWRPLPSKIRCAGETERVLQPDGFGDFVTHVARSSDGRMVGIRGGWQSAPLAGAGADCFYEVDGEKLTFAGCLRTWIS